MARSRVVAGLSWLVRAARDRELPVRLGSTRRREPIHAPRGRYPRVCARYSAPRHVATSNDKYTLKRSQTRPLNVTHRRCHQTPGRRGRLGVRLGCVAAPKNLIRTRAAYSSVERRNKADS